MNSTPHPLFSAGADGSLPQNNRISAAVRHSASGCVPWLDGQPDPEKEGRPEKGPAFGLPGSLFDRFQRPGSVLQREIRLLPGAQLVSRMVRNIIESLRHSIQIHALGVFALFGRG